MPSDWVTATSGMGEGMGSSTLTFTDYLNSFTESTLTLVNSGHQIRDAINRTTAQAPAPTRQDNPATSGGLPLWVWILGAVVVYKKVLK